MLRDLGALLAERGSRLLWQVRDGRFFFAAAAAFLAARERLAALRLRTAECAGGKAPDEEPRAARVCDGFLLVFFAPFSNRAFACLHTDLEAVPFVGGDNFTPARRAFDKPIAIACMAERAPCFPSRMCSISSRTNSPA